MPDRHGDDQPGGDRPDPGPWKPGQPVYLKEGQDVLLDGDGGNARRIGIRNGRWVELLVNDAAPIPDEPRTRRQYDVKNT